MTGRSDVSGCAHSDESAKTTGVGFLEEKLSRCESLFCVRFNLSCA